MDSKKLLIGGLAVAAILLGFFVYKASEANKARDAEQQKVEALELELVAERQRETKNAALATEAKRLAEEKAKLQADALAQKEAQLKQQIAKEEEAKAKAIALEKEAQAKRDAALAKAQAAEAEAKRLQEARQIEMTAADAKLKQAQIALAKAQENQSIEIEEARRLAREEAIAEMEARAARAGTISPTTVGASRPTVKKEAVSYTPFVNQPNNKRAAHQSMTSLLEGRGSR